MCQQQNTITIFRNHATRLIAKSQPKDRLCSLRVLEATKSRRIHRTALKLVFNGKKLILYNSCHLPSAKLLSFAGIFVFAWVLVFSITSPQTYYSIGHRQIDMIVRFSVLRYLLDKLPNFSWIRQDITSIFVSCLSFQYSPNFHRM